ncbi:MAG: phosphatase PAP2 family protein [Chitinophagaceae bacterium]|nr:MAG: phosphatase PAP2 family protein [Chitinophagaceae bacterium]
MVNNGVALEPHWWRLRTFFLDSARQFMPAPLAGFDTASVSPFYRMLYAVYHAGKNLTTEQQDIAMFWDCNPFAVQQIGHVEFALKKISPGGHWIGITGIACLKDNKSLAQTAFIHALVSLTLCDAFIACWDEKYRTNRIRPETAINRWVDPRWRPLLQTPPFPEYTSGHSVISAASATILSRFFGDRFSFTDNTEAEFGLKARRFRSFLHAAEEAGISRFYGGIHYQDAIDNGQAQGKKIADFILGKVPL